MLTWLSHPCNDTQNENDIFYIFKIAFEKPLSNQAFLRISIHFYKTLLHKNASRSWRLKSVTCINSTTYLLLTKPAVSTFPGFTAVLYFYDQINNLAV